MEAIDALKQKILSLAIQGKLIPQDPSDEPASELLKKIKAEKAELVKQGKIKKDKQESRIFKGDDNKYYEQIGTEIKDITDEIPFDIPNNWEWVRINNLGIYKKGPFGSALTKSIFVPKSDNAIKVYEQKNAIYKNENLGDYYITKEYFESHMKGFEVSAGDIIVSCAGTIGETFILPATIERGIINQALMRIKLYNNVYKEYFLMYFDYILKKSAQMYSKGSAIKNIPPFDVFKQMLCPIPPLSEQKRIVSEIERIFEQIEVVKTNQEELSKLKDGLKNKILDLAIQGKLVEQDPSDEPASELLKKIKAEKAELVKQGKIKKDKQESRIFKGDDNRHYEQIGSEVRDITEEIPFDIPNNWEWCRLGSVFDIRDGTHDTPRYYPQGVPLITSKNLCNGAISYQNVKYISKEDANKINERSYVDNGDILFGMIGTIGKPVIVDKKVEFCIKNVALIKNLLNQNIKYCYYLLLAMEEFMNKNASGGLQPFVSLNYIRNLLIPLPPMKEQERIATKLNAIMNIIKVL